MPRSVQDPLTSSAVNVEGTLNVLLAARDEGVRRVVFSSSSSIYGSAGELPRTEAMTPDPISPYGVAKLAAERYCVSFGRVYESFEAVVLRYFNVFGPRQSPRSQYAAVVPLFLTAIARGEPVTIYGDGEQSRDFTFVSNVVDATVRAADAPGASGRIFNVAAGSPATRERARRPDRDDPRPRARAAVRAAAAGRRPRLVGRRHAPRARRSATRPASGSRRACAGPPTRCSAELSRRRRCGRTP